jgi:hypothetical protein
MEHLITFCRRVFIALTIVVSGVAVIMIFSDANPNARLFWIGAAITCIGVITTWRPHDKTLPITDDLN